jgi:hypothetical protein
MNEWRNQIKERVRVLFPVEKRARGTFESADGLPSLKYLSSMMNLSSLAPSMQGQPELMQILHERCLLLFFHPSALQPRDIARYIRDCMLACEEINAAVSAWPTAEMPEPPQESALLIFARKIATHDIDQIARLVPLEGTPWAYRLRTTQTSRVDSNDSHTSPILVVDASSPDLPSVGRWLLSAPGQEDDLDEVLASETLPADMRQRIVVYSAALSNAEATRRTLSQASRLSVDPLQRTARGN